MSIAHHSLFFLVVGSKTIVSVGQACLTVEATVLAFNCLGHFQSPEALSVFLQITAATFSVLVIVLSRFPSIWDNLSLRALRRQFNDLRTAAAACSPLIKAMLVLISLMGLLSCFARGMSAYLGVEVLLGDRAKASAGVVGFFGGLAALTVTASAMCFNLSNMLTSAAHYLQKPSFRVRPSTLLSMMATLSTAVAMRFFIQQFLTRREVSETEQVLGQVVFTLAEFILGCFTMVSSFKDNWQRKAKKTLSHSVVFTVLLMGDSLTAWLGYNTITWYSILSDSFFKEDCGPSTHPNEFVWRLVFMSFACLISIPSTLCYLHYLLDYAKEGFNRTIDLLPSSCQSYRFRLFKPPFSRLHELPAPDEVYKMYPQLNKEDFLCFQ